MIDMRKPRKLKHGARYHIIARANRQELILKSKKIKNLFLRVIKRAKKKYKFSVQNFCIMGNHVHLILQPLENENLSKIMQWILSVFAMRFNKIFNYIGHVWYDRFKSKIIHSFRQFLATFLYIADNPVRAGIVKKADEYMYNGIHFFSKGSYGILDPPPIWLKLLGIGYKNVLTYKR